MAIKIVTDSTSYIPKKYLEKYDLKEDLANGKPRTKKRQET